MGKSYFENPDVSNYKLGRKIEYESLKLTKSNQEILKNYEFNADKAVSNALRADLLLDNEPNLLEVDDGLGRTTRVKQHQLVANLDLVTAKKFFQLKLDQFGPYHCKYTPNGKFLLIGGSRGHLAGFNWRSKNLQFEIQVMDRIHDITYLNNETRLAVAQKSSIFFYNNAGTEINRIKVMANPRKLEYLTHHFLLATGRKLGFLSYLDTSTGNMISDIKTNNGEISTMAQNQFNAFIATGHSNGTVAFWTPNYNQYQMKILCHPAPIVSCAINRTGNLLATSDMSGYIKIWDIRDNEKALRSFRNGSYPACNLTFSDTDMLAFNSKRKIQIWRNVDDPDNDKWQYMQHEASDIVSCLRFCPFDDVLGVGFEKGFDSIIIPGSGISNYDALESNPFETTSQRREHEVKQLLDKVQPELIHHNPNSILKIGKPDPNFEKSREDALINRLLPRMPKKAKRGKKISTVHSKVRSQIDRERRVIKIKKEIRKSLKKTKKL